MQAAAPPKYFSGYYTTRITQKQKKWKEAVILIYSTRKVELYAVIPQQQLNPKLIFKEHTAFQSWAQLKPYLKYLYSEKTQTLQGIDSEFRLGSFLVQTESRMHLTAMPTEEGGDDLPQSMRELIGTDCFKPRLAMPKKRHTKKESSSLDEDMEELSITPRATRKAFVPPKLTSISKPQEPELHRAQPSPLEPLHYNFNLDSFLQSQVPQKENPSDFTLCAPSQQADLVDTEDSQNIPPNFFEDVLSSQKAQGRAKEERKEESEEGFKLDEVAQKKKYRFYFDKGKGVLREGIDIIRRLNI